MTNSPSMNDLTKRESDIARLIPLGLSDSEIGYRLGLATGTAKLYLSQIFAKWDVHTRTEVAVIVTRHQVRAEMLDAIAMAVRVMADPCPDCGGTDYICFHCAADDEPSFKV